MAGQKNRKKNNSPRLKPRRGSPGTLHGVILDSLGTCLCSQQLGGEGKSHPSLAAGSNMLVPLHTHPEKHKKHSSKTSSCVADVLGGISISPLEAHRRAFVAGRQRHTHIRKASHATSCCLAWYGE